VSRRRTIVDDHARAVGVDRTVSVPDALEIVQDPLDALAIPATRAPVSERVHAVLRY